MKLYEIADQLPPDVATAFNQTGELQRGEPERAMVNAQRVLGSGSLSYALEHVGDITHRMTRQGGLMSWGIEEAATKIARMYKLLNHPYGFDREVAEQLQANSEYAHIPEAKFARQVNTALRQYAEAHSRLPVYNGAQYCAKEAAVSLGQTAFAVATNYLDSLYFKTKNQQKWLAACLEYRLDEHGQLLQYPYPRQYLRMNQPQPA